MCQNIYLPIGQQQLFYNNANELMSINTPQSIALQTLDINSSKQLINSKSFTDDFLPINLQNNYKTNNELISQQNHSLLINSVNSIRNDAVKKSVNNENLSVQFVPLCR